MSTELLKYYTYQVPSDPSLRGHCICMPLAEKCDVGFRWILRMNVDLEILCYHVFSSPCIILKHVCGIHSPFHKKLTKKSNFYKLIIQTLIIWTKLLKGTK